MIIITYQDGKSMNQQENQEIKRWKLKKKNVGIGFFYNVIKAVGDDYDGTQKIKNKAEK